MWEPLARLEQRGRRLQNIMTEAAAVGLGYPPPPLSSSPPESEVEVVTLMRDSDADDEGEGVDYGFDYGFEDGGDGEDGGWMTGGVEVASSVTLSDGDAAAAVAEGPREGYALEFTTDPQPSAFRSVTGVASTGDAAAEAALAGDGEVRGEDGDAPGDAMQDESSLGPASSSVGLGLTNEDGSEAGGEATAAALEMKTKAGGGGVGSPVARAGAAGGGPAAAQSSRETPRGVKRPFADASASMTPRRSKRIEVRPPPPPSRASSPLRTQRAKGKAKAKATPRDGSDERWQCEHCGRQLMRRKGARARHLAACDASKARTAAAAAVSVKVEAAEASSSPGGAVTALESLGDELVGRAAGAGRGSVEAPAAAADQAKARLWLFGSPANADRVKAHYGHAPCAVAAPVERLRALVRKRLGGLEVPRMLDALPSDARVSMVLGPQGHARRSAAVAVASAAQAKELHALGLSLSFPAPPRAADLVVGTLARDLGVGRLAERWAAVTSLRAGGAVEWQLHRSECVVLLLEGAAAWKLRAGGARYPLRCFHPRSRSLREADEAVKVLGLARDADGAGPARVAPPFDPCGVLDAVEDAADAPVEAVVRAGAVVYMPAGTWFAVETAAGAVWMEAHVRPVTGEQAVLGALRPLLWRSDLWRSPLGASGARDGARAHAAALLADLKAKVAALTPHDVAPAYALLAGEGALDVEADLRTREPFRGAVKLQQGAAYRVSPAAVLLRADEVPHDARAGEPQAPDEHAFVLHAGFGNDAFASAARVQFRCSAAQAALVDWLRARAPGEEFSLETLKRGGAAAGGDAVGEDAAKRLLRFLLSAGFVTPAPGE